VLEELFHCPSLQSKGGKIIFAALIPIYWSIAFVIAAGIPDFSGLTGVVAAICILQFTYTFPPLLSLGYMLRKNAALPGEGFDPVTGKTITQDSGMKRVMRGFMGGKWYMNMFNVLVSFSTCLPRYTVRWRKY
jgi:hypothetical protein